MILSSFVFQRKVDFSLYFAMRLTLFEETHFSILSRPGFNFKGFCSRMSFGIVHYFFFAFGVLILSYFVLFDDRKV